jgi:hypothetical protein
VQPFRKFPAILRNPKAQAYNKSIENVAKIKHFEMTVTIQGEVKQRPFATPARTQEDCGP